MATNILLREYAIEWPLSYHSHLEPNIHRANDENSLFFFFQIEVNIVLRFELEKMVAQIGGLSLFGGVYRVCIKGCGCLPAFVTGSSNKKSCSSSSSSEVVVVVVVVVR